MIKNGVGKGIHVGLIPDGNRRFALRNKKLPWEGHLEGTQRIKDFLNWCLEYPEIKRISIYALSTENLNRSQDELDALWKIYKEELGQILSDPVIKEKGVKVRVLGNDTMWRPDVKEVVKEVSNSTKQYSKHILNIMLAYGSNFELSNAVKNVIKKPFATIDRHLLVKEPLDLVIRTGGQRRLSNFMLYQASYAELYFTDTLWPAFTKKEFDKIIDWYHLQKKKFGK